MSVLSLSRLVSCIYFLAAMTLVAPAETFTTLISFNGTDGSRPPTSLAQGPDGNFYGTTSVGGTNCGTGINCGTVFKITPAGELTTLYNFCGQTNCSDGREPGAPLILATDGNFYGTTTFGGVDGNYGTIFKITPSGTLTTIYRFCQKTKCPDGSYLYSGLVQGSNGNFYGTTNGGGSSKCDCGTVFKITPTGDLTTLHKFHLADGAQPYAGLIQATDGDFYGTTVYGGEYKSGTIFRITAGGEFKTLYNFCSHTGCTDGSSPAGNLVQAVDGTFYGVTGGGGTSNFGTFFAMTPSGALTTLHSFGVADGFNPAWLMQGSDGNFYGVTEMGADVNDGIVFKTTAQGEVTVFHSFSGNDGRYPHGIGQATNGSFYGTTDEGGDGNGTVFRISRGLSHSWQQYLHLAKLMPRW
jgi:uncharacterized repeat protein (TIGR03803 family)